MGDRGAVPDTRAQVRGTELADSPTVPSGTEDGATALIWLGERVRQDHRDLRDHGGQRVVARHDHTTTPHPDEDPHRDPIGRARARLAGIAQDRGWRLLVAAVLVIAKRHYGKTWRA